MRCSGQREQHIKGSEAVWGLASGEWSERAGAPGTDMCWEGSWRVAWRGRLCSPRTTPKPWSQVFLESADLGWPRTLLRQGWGAHPGRGAPLSGAIFFNLTVTPRGSERCPRRLSPTLLLRLVFARFHPPISRSGHAAQGPSSNPGRALEPVYGGASRRFPEAAPPRPRGRKICGLHSFHSSEKKLQIPTFPAGWKESRKEDKRERYARLVFWLSAASELEESFRGRVEPGHIKITKEGHR